ncbi:MAG: hypothetical protein ABWX93_11135 [Pseudoxanthomonas sp.]
MLRAIAMFTAVALAGLAHAQSSAELAGTWVWEVEGRNLVVLTLESRPQGLVGTLHRPSQLSFAAASSGLAVHDIRMPILSGPVEQASQIADGTVMRTTGGNGSQQFVVRSDGKGAMLFRFDPNPAAPTVTLIRPRDPAAVATDWDPGREYLSRGEVEKSSTEMATIYAADQADRKEMLDTDWKVVAPRDKVRRQRVKQMLDEGLLHSGEDFHRAAFVFQHGETADDFLLAHVLAMAAQGKGHPEAGWIAMATLDRYLQSAGRAQILGTQNPFAADGSITRGLYDETLIPDSLRVALGVPTRAQEAAQRAAMEAARQK